VAGWWNVAAGRPLFVLNSAPAIAFRVKTPIFAGAEQDLGGLRIVSAVDQVRDASGTISCTVWYDPTFVAYGVPGRHLSARVLAHEVGHCLELSGHQACPSLRVMSLCDFWARAIAGWGPGAEDTVQLRAAGYIR
jgi:hypothetical protein